MSHISFAGQLPRQQRLEELTRALTEHQRERTPFKADQKVILAEPRNTGSSKHELAESASERHNSSSTLLRADISADDALQDSLSRLRLNTASDRETAGSLSMQSQLSKRQKRSRSISHDGMHNHQIQTPRADSNSHKPSEMPVKSHRERHGLRAYCRTPPQTPKSSKRNIFGSETRWEFSK